MPNFVDEIKINGTSLFDTSGNYKKGGFLGKGVVTGGAAGDHTVTGIATTDELVLVLYFVGAGTDVTDITDLTSEFTITAANTINNTGGTATTGGKLLVLYLNLL